MGEFKNTISLITETMLDIKKLQQSIKNGEVESTTREATQLNDLLNEYGNAKIILGNFNQ